jgi:hypothetical protein
MVGWSATPVVSQRVRSCRTERAQDGVEGDASGCNRASG